MIGTGMNYFDNMDFDNDGYDAIFVKGAREIFYRFCCEHC